MDNSRARQLRGRAAPDRQATRRDFLADGVLIFFLSAVAFAQPLYDVLSRGAELFVASRSEPIDVLSLVAFVSILVPGALLAAQVAVGLLGARAGVASHRVIAGLLFAILLLPAVKGFELPTVALLTAAGAGGVAFAWGLAGGRWLRRRSVLVAASLVAVTLPLWFLLATPVRKVLRDDDSDSAYRAAAPLKTPVVLVVLDELASTTLMNAEREIDADLFPGFHALAAESTWYRNATTVADFTIHAVPALLTGKYPEAGLLPTAEDHPDNLFTLLGGRNPLVVEERETHLCPRALCENAADLEPYRRRMSSLLSDIVILYGHIVLPDELAAARLPPVTAAWHDFSRRNDATDGAVVEPDRPRGRVDVLTRFIRSLEPTRKPGLHYIHAGLPHHPWQFAPSGKSYGARLAWHLRDFAGKQWGADEWLATQGFQRHVMQTMFTDKLLAEMLDRLKATGLYDPSLLIVTADHGVSFRPGDARRALTKTNYSDLMPVPLFVKRPGQTAGSISDHNVELIDVLPTIADVQGIEVPWRIDGRPLGDAAPRAEKRVFTDAGESLRFSASFDEKYDALAWKLSLTGAAGGPFRPFRMTPDGRYRALLDLPVAALRRAPEQWRGELDLPAVFEDVDPSSGAVPCRVSGRIYAAETSPPLLLAIAVNGIVRAITRTYPEGSSRRFTAMIAEDSLDAGRNDVAVYSIQAGGTLPRLSRVSTGEATYRLETAEDGETEVIHAADGRILPLEAGRITGKIRRGRVFGEMVVFRGEAAETGRLGIPRSLLVFERGDFVFALEQDQRTRAGTSFELKVPRAALPDLDAAEIRIFAVSEEGYASELRYTRNFQSPARKRPRSASD